MDWLKNYFVGLVGSPRGWPIGRRKGWFWLGGLVGVLFFVGMILGATIPVWGQKGSKPTFQLYEPHEIVPPLPSGWGIPLAERPVFAALIMLALLGCVTVAVLKFRSRRGVLAAAGISVALLGFWLGGCPCPVGSIQNVTMGIFGSTGSIPWPFLILFFVPLIWALFFGRIFCASVCPLGAVQEFVAIWPVRIPKALDETLSLGRYVYLGLAVLFAAGGMSFLICRFDPIAPIFRGLTGPVSVLIFAGVMLTVGLFVARPYCRYLCPYGGLLAWSGRLAARHPTVSPGDCSGCSLCKTVCPYHAILPPTIPPDREERRVGPKRLAVTLAIAPVLIFVGALFGRVMAAPLAERHPTVRRAELVRAEETGVVGQFGAFDETLSHYRAGGDNLSLYASAANITGRFKWFGTFFGGWVGLVVAARLVTLARRKKRTDYEIDAGRCFACGRCFWYCPNQSGERLLLLESKTEGP